MIHDLRLHHHGLAVREDTEALTFLALLGYNCSVPVYDPVQNVRLRLCSHDAMPTVEIVMPGEGPGPLDAILRRQDQLLYHTCYEVDDRAAVLGALEQADLRVFEVLGPTPAILFGGRQVSFHTVLGFGLIELLDRA